MQAEVDLLVEALAEATPARVVEWPIWAGTIGGVEVVVARAGLGKVNTSALAAILWERHRPSLMMFTGVAGGLDPGLDIGDIVIGEQTLQHDAGVITPNGLERYQPGHVPFFNPTDRLGYRPSTASLDRMRATLGDVELTQVLGRSPRVIFGTILTGDQFLDDAPTRDRLFAELSAHAIEMEGAALAQTAARLRVDHLVIRSLSDRAGEGAIEDFGRFVPEVAANSARLVLGFIRRLQEDDRDLTVGA
jgi:adenosylhomocysteine nucleosidase